MTKKQKIKKIIEILHEKFGNPKCALNYETPFELLVAVSLSAQCTDKRVNIVTEEMFNKKKINTPEQFANMELEEIEKLVKSTGFYKNKAKNIKKTSEILLEKYNGEVPKEMDKLVDLAGVGRKTANVVRGEIWGIAEGITVDTHVKRLVNLIGLVKSDNPIIIERELMKIVPKKYWIDISHYLILQGRDICIARRPKCKECEINIYCNFGRKKLKKQGVILEKL
ncbi:MAG: endonuclease III [Fusobacteria bacterium]|nr:MAG: endonuclease III [Fusobacteriota bacterium]